MSDRRFFFILSGLVLASCSNGMSSVPSAPVRVATKAEVAQCAYVTNISDKPGLYGALASQGIEYARKAIIDGAAQAGANTVVFDPVDPGSMVTNLTATAYRC